MKPNFTLHEEFCTQEPEQRRIRFQELMERYILDALCAAALIPGV